MNSTGTKPADQPQPLPFLVGSIADNLTHIDTCPFAGSITCWSTTHNRHLLIALPCKRWGCRWCGPRRAKRLAYRVEEAAPNRLITLTINPKVHIDPRAAYDATRRQLSDFAKGVRKVIGEFEYVRILEVTKQGWPHYHLMARCEYISQRVISDIWAKLTAAPIVDIRKIQKTDKVFWYVVKYLCKQTAVPWTNRRVSWSGKFFPKPEEKTDEKWKLASKFRTMQHPTTVAANSFPGEQLRQITSNAWAVEPAASNHLLRKREQLDDKFGRSDD